MNTPLKIVVVAALAAAVAGALVLKAHHRPASAVRPEPGRTALAAVTPPAAPAPVQRPRLLDLGATRCIPCKMMAPVLEELKKEYDGRFEVVFIDVWQNPEAGRQYHVEMIPTQIFFDADGQERFRHIGFFGKQDILAKWNELGLRLAEGQ